MTTNLQEVKQEKPTSFSSESVFKVLIIILGTILATCISRIFQFRQYCKQKGLYVFAEDSLVYCFVSFILIFIIKYSYYYISYDWIQTIIHVRYVGEERVIKTKSVVKLIFDSIFYTVTSVLAYYLFRKQNWFPTMIGGQGACSTIYNNYPDWPINKRTQMEVYFMIQLGVHMFSVFEMGIIKGPKQRKFYEFLLHHFVAASLILCSMMCNEIAAGIIILIVHDFSDIFLASSRAYAEVNNHKNMIIAPMVAALIIFWIYMRIIVFPFCLLANVYINKPTARDDWNMIHFPYMYLLCMAFVLFGMHIFWTYYILKSALKAVRKNEVVNLHEKAQNKKK